MEFESVPYAQHAMSSIQASGFFENSKIEYLFNDPQQLNVQNPSPYNPYPQYSAPNIQPSNIGSYPLVKPETNPLDRLINQPSYSIDSSYQQQFVPIMGYGQVNPFGEYPPAPKPSRGPDPYMG